MESKLCLEIKVTFKKYSIQHLQTMLEADSQRVQHSQFFLQCSNRWLNLWVSTRRNSWLAFEAILYKKILIFKH